jgi:hypothetical protein
MSGTGEADDHGREEAGMAFPGRPEEALNIYEGLAADNSRTHWTRQKDLHEAQVRGPMAAPAAET